jgi:hypothetical protein
MQTQNTLPENLTYGIQLWQLNCLYWDGHNYRFSRHHRAVDPTMRGRIAVPVNQALKSHFASPAELHTASAKGPHPPMHDDLRTMLPRGSSVYTVVTRESRTGSNCHLLVLAVVAGEIVSVTAAAAKMLGLNVEHGSLVKSGSRASAGGRIVSLLAVALYQDARVLTHIPLG